jgi:uncharacterized Zn finger protein
MEPYECDECGGNGEYEVVEYDDGVTEIKCLACGHVAEIREGDEEDCDEVPF